MVTSGQPLIKVKGFDLETSQVAKGRAGHSAASGKYSAHGDDQRGRHASKHASRLMASSARGQTAASGFAREKIYDADEAIYAVVENTQTSIKIFL